MPLVFSFDLFSQALAELADVQVHFCADADEFGGRAGKFLCRIMTTLKMKDLILRHFSSFNFWINFDEKISLEILLKLI